MSPRPPSSATARRHGDSSLAGGRSGRWRAVSDLGDHGRDVVDLRPGVARFVAAGVRRLDQPASRLADVVGTAPYDAAQLAEREVVGDPVGDRDEKVAVVDRYLPETCRRQRFAKGPLHDVATLEVE